MKLNDDGSGRIANVPKRPLSMLVEGSCRKHARNVCANQLDAMPPSGCGFGIVSHITNMAQWNIELALKRPQLVKPFYFEMKVIVGDGKFHHSKPLK